MLPDLAQWNYLSCPQSCIFFLKWVLIHIGNNLPLHVQCNKYLHWSWVRLRTNQTIWSKSSLPGHHGLWWLQLDLVVLLCFHQELRLHVYRASLQGPSRYTCVEVEFLWDDYINKFLQLQMKVQGYSSILTIVALQLSEDDSVICHLSVWTSQYLSLWWSQCSPDGVLQLQLWI